MMFTHEQLSNAVREVGRDGKPFTSAAVRGALGLRTQDRRILTRFNSEFRLFQKDMGPELEKLANNRYRLSAVDSNGVAAASVVEQVQQVQQQQPELVDAPQVSEPAISARANTARADEIDLAAATAKRPIDRFSLRSTLTGLWRPAFRRVRLRGQRLGGRVVELVDRASRTIRTRAGYPRALRQRAVSRVQSALQHAGGTPAGELILRIYRSTKRSRSGAHA